MAARPVLPRLSVSLSRSVVHHARPPRVPAIRNPHEASVPRPTEGTSTAHPTHLGGAAEPSTSATTLEGTNLTFHYSPPPTAPSYTTGVKPEFLRWVKGEQVRLTGEEVAPLRKPESAEFKPRMEFSQEMKNKIVELRAIGRSRSEIAKELNIPPTESRRIAQVASLSKAQQLERAAALERQKATWGDKKSLAREIRQRRKAFW